MLSSSLVLPEDRWTRLESLVARLGLECRRLHRENRALMRALAEREQEIARLRAQQREHEQTRKDVARFLSARDHIQERVDELLAWLDLVELPLSAQNGHE